MKRILLLYMLLLANAALSQTRLIAHKSHSGNIASYSTFDASGNFGEPPPILKSVEKINDTAVILTHQEWFDTSVVWSDTFYRHPIFSNPNMPVDSMKKAYHMKNVEFKNFDKDPKAKPQKATPSKASGKEAGTPKEKKKRSFIWLLLIGGGTFLAAGLSPLAFRSLSARRA